MSNEFVSRTGIKIDGDASGLQEASKLTRREMSAMRRVLRETKDETEKIQDKIEDVNELYNKGALSVEDATRAMNRYHQQLPGTKRATEELRQEQERAKQVYNSTRTPLENHQREVRELSRLHRRGRIDQETYNRAVRQSKNAHGQGMSGILSQIPVLNRFTGAAGGMTGSLGALSVGLVGVGVAAGGLSILNRKLSETRQEIDKLAKNSRKLGIATEELVGLRRAANRLSGIDSQQFDTAMQRVVRRVSEASNGMGESQKTLTDDLKLNAQELSQLRPEEMIHRLSDAMKENVPETERLRVAFKLFDSEGAGLVTMLAAGSDELKKYTEDAKRAGTALTSWETSQIEAANDAVADANEEWQGLWNQLAVETVPIVMELSDMLGDTAKWLKEVMAGFGENADGLSSFGAQAALTIAVFRDLADVAMLAHKAMTAPLSITSDDLKQAASFDKYDESEARLKKLARDTAINSQKPARIPVDFEMKAESYKKIQTEIESIQEEFAEFGIDQKININTNDVAMANQEIEKYKKTLEGLKSLNQIKSGIDSSNESLQKEIIALQQGKEAADNYALSRKLNAVILPPEIMKKEQEGLNEQFRLTSQLLAKKKELEASKRVDDINFKIQTVSQTTEQREISQAYRSGATEQEIQAMRRLHDAQRQYEANQKRIETQQASRKRVDDLKFELAMIGKTDAQREIAAAKRSGATRQELGLMEMIRLKREAIDSVQTEDPQLKIAKRGSAEAQDAIDRARNIDRPNPQNRVKDAIDQLLQKKLQVEIVSDNSEIEEQTRLQRNSEAYLQQIAASSSNEVEL